MGTIISQGSLIGGAELTGEAKESFEQIIEALNQEIHFRSRDHHSHHRHHQESREKEEPLRHINPRSHSLDRYLPEEHIHTPQSKLSHIKRQWQCQLCHTKNESDTLICSECGSNKINVYIPIIDRTRKHQRLQNASAFSSPALPSTPVKYRKINLVDNDLISFFSV